MTFSIHPRKNCFRAIFGEKSREVRDTSLRVPPGIEGTVIDVKYFSRSGMRKDKRYKDIVAARNSTLENDFAMQVATLEKMIEEKILQLFKGKTARR